eukprot:3289766-Pyramimonas_sp.AAC.1
MVASTAGRDELRNTQPEDEPRDRHPKCDDHRQYDTKRTTKIDGKYDSKSGGLNPAAAIFKPTQTTITPQARKDSTGATWCFLSQMPKPA